MSTDLAPVESTADVMAIIARGASDPNFDISKMERLVALKERMDADARRTAYFRDLAQLQAELPRITKTARIIVKGVERSRYAPLEDIDKTVRPFMAKYGFSFIFNTPPSPDPQARCITCKMTHRDGHSETLETLMPVDHSDYRSAPQNAQSVDSYAKRQLVKNHLNLVEAGEDNDGADIPQNISVQQAKWLRDLLEEISGDEAKFLHWLGVGKIENVLLKDYGRAEKFLLKKRDEKAKKK